ncbi:MAG: S9 family peptidase [Acidimicrobiia bacterium]
MKHIMTAEDLWALPRVGQPSIGGGKIVVPVTRYEGTSSTTTFTVLAGEGSVALTQTDAKSPAVSPDGSRVAFIRSSEPEGPGQLHVMPLDGGEAERVTDMPLGVIGPKWMPDGRGVLFLSPLYEEALTVEATRAFEPPTVRVTERRMFRYWDRWLTDGKIPHLFLLDLTTRALNDLTPDATNWWMWNQEGDSYDVSPDGKEVAFSAFTVDTPEDQRHSVVFLVPVAGGPLRCITLDGTGHERRPRYSPDGASIVYGMQRELDFYADRVRLVRFDRSSEQHHVLTEEWDRSASDWEFAADGTLLFTAEDAARVNVYRLTDGDPETIGTGGTYGAPVPIDGGFVTTYQDLSHPPEVVRVDGGRRTALTQLTAGVIDELELGPVEAFHFDGAHGDRIQGFIVYPPGFDPARRWPLVHMIHGGPHGVFGDTFHFRWNAHAFAAPGYVVALVNFHGSTSWGQAFAESIQGAWGAMPTEDILKATDHLLSLGFIDEGHMAITGGSYGGYLTTWLTTQTDRFACAIAHAAVTNFSGMYASDMTRGRPRAYGADYWTDPDTVDRWSPSRHAGGYSTPTLVIVGEHDYRVPLTQGLELYGILKAKGVEARLVYYPDENHWILKRDNSIRWYDEVHQWLHRYLQPSVEGS